MAADGTGSSERPPEGARRRNRRSGPAPDAPTLFRAVHRAKGIDLSENTAATDAEPAEMEEAPAGQDAVLLFVGGSLDGRV